MPRSAVLSVLLLLAGTVTAATSPRAPADLSLAELEQRLSDLNGQLALLANYNLSGGVGAIGSRSRGYETARQDEWIEIDLGDPVPLDQVVLVPALRRDGLKGFQADGFPREFRLRAGRRGDPEGRVVAEFSDRDGLLPRIAPVVVACGGLAASWIRIEATLLSRREFDGKFVLQFAEVLAFSGEENAALHRPVRYPANRDRTSSPGWPDTAVVDGFLPYLMATAGGSNSVAFLSSTELGERPTLTIDLGTTHPLNRLHLHAVDQSDTVPQTYAGDVGIPRLLRVDGAAAPDFSDARVLAELHHDSLYDVGPILMRSFPATPCRYVRLVGLRLNNDPLLRAGQARLGFAEIELFAQGRNVALHRPVAANFRTDDPARPLPNLTDGRNFYGELLPVRAWLNQLALRHELERERPLVGAELNRRYARQKTNVALLAALAAVLGLGVIGIAAVNRSRRQRAIEDTRKRIAADLHDELGADLHAIGLLSDLALSARASPERLADLLQRMRALTERTGKAARRCTNLLETAELHGDPLDDLRHAADRILADLDHRIDVDGAPELRRLSPRRRIDLLLFYQETLINILRHSGATRAQTRVKATSGTITLEVTDNGRGLDGRVPDSLKRRARLLGAELTAGGAEPKGARIVLHLKRRRFGFLP
jgi:signal transduction histidine kinase